MDKEMRKTLRLFQCDFNRSIEETFAQVLTENERVRLFFINENQAFTDGQNTLHTIQHAKCMLPHNHTGRLKF
jgi:hypothetical protein